MKSALLVENALISVMLAPLGLKKKAVKKGL
jgi:hypothetical protein